MRNGVNGLIHEDIPRYDPWIKMVLGGVLALTFILGIVFLFRDLEAALAMFGITLFDALLFKVILPSRFQVFEDRLVVVLGGPLAISIPFSNLEAARPVAGEKAFIYWGIRFATSSRGVVEIVRKKGLNLVISPANREAFLEQLYQAQAARRL